MNFYELIKLYGSGKGEAAMWAATKRVSEYLEEVKEHWALIKETYADMCGPHYNEQFAMWQIEQMFYKDMKGDIHYAPNWSMMQYKASFEQNKHRLKRNTYNHWDWAVALEMAYTDFHCLLKTWYPDASDEEIKAKAVDVAVNFLNDDDDPEDGRIWRKYNR